MDEGMICACCGNKISAETSPECDYCGYVNIAVMGNSAANEKGAAKHRKKILERLKNISVVSYEYGWKKEENEYAQLNKETLKLADGEQCDEKILWSTQEFGQIFDDEKITIEVSYKYDGKGWKVEKYELRPVKCDSFWHIGVEVNKQLKLTFYLGDDKHMSKGGEIAFIKR